MTAQPVARDSDKLDSVKRRYQRKDHRVPMVSQTKGIQAGHNPEKDQRDQIADQQRRQYLRSGTREKSYHSTEMERLDQIEVCR